MRPARVPVARVVLGIAGLGFALLAMTPAQGQVMSRTATTVRAILRYSVFFHDKALTVLGTPVEVANGAQVGLAVGAPKLFVIVPRTGHPPDRLLEFRGRLFDIGRFASDDSRLGPLNLPSVIASVAGDRWPARETLFVLTGATWVDTPSRPDASLRAIALQPEVFDGRTVTVRGRFRGRNLFGDVPAWPRQSQWDFVLQAADAAVWIVGRRPRGSGFDLSTTNRAQTGRWLVVTGRVQLQDDLPMIVAGSIAVADAEVEEKEAIEPVAPPLPPPAVVFSAPTQNELDIARDVVVRVQFSRPLREDTLTGHVRVRYTAPDTAPPVPAFTVTYRPGPMAIEIRFAEPLARFTEVQVELTEGIAATDGVPLVPMVLRFTTSVTSVTSPPLQSRAGRP